jgi:hypothetical protein
MNENGSEICVIVLFYSFWPTQAYVFTRRAASAGEILIGMKDGHN